MLLGVCVDFFSSFDVGKNERQVSDNFQAARRGVQERGAALCAPRWPNFLGGGILRVGDLGGELGGLGGLEVGGGVGGVGGGGVGEGEDNLGGVRVGLGHRFAAAWERVRAAFGDG